MVQQINIDIHPYNTDVDTKNIVPLRAVLWDCDECRHMFNYLSKISISYCLGREIWIYIPIEVRDEVL